MTAPPPAHFRFRNKHYSNAQIVAKTIHNRENEIPPVPKRVTVRRVEANRIYLYLEINFLSHNRNVVAFEKSSVEGLRVLKLSQ